MDNLQTIDSYNKIILDNEWLIYKIINKYTSHLELEDLYQVASIGLIKAYKSFKDDYNTKFSTYAVPLILGEIRKHFRENGLIKISRKNQEIYREIKCIETKLENELGRNITIQDTTKIITILLRFKLFP